MRCPYCQSPVAPTAAKCSACQLTFSGVCGIMGATPRLSPVVADPAGRLTKWQRGAVKRRIDRIREHFPELFIQIVIQEFPPPHPISTQLFWLFNVCSFGGSSRAAGNHTFLLAVDPVNGEAAAMPGYGLEPFLTEDRIDSILEVASPFWRMGRWSDGLLAALDALEDKCLTFAIPEVVNQATHHEF